MNGKAKGFRVWLRLLRAAAPVIAASACVALESRGAAAEADAHLEVFEVSEGSWRLRLVEHASPGPGRWVVLHSENLKDWNELGTLFFDGQDYGFFLGVENGKQPRYFRARFEGIDIVERLEEARNRWSVQGPARYRMEVFFWSSFFFWEGEVTVHGGEVVEAVARETNFFEPPEPFTVEDWFGVLDDAIGRRAENIQAVFDPVLGYPAEVFIDYHLGIADEERGWRIDSLTPLP